MLCSSLVGLMVVGSVLWATPVAGVVTPTPPIASPTSSAARAGTYSPPLRAEVIDPFRAPEHRFGPGNRGLEYRTRPGTAVGAIGAGRVAFAGQVAGRLVVSVDHPDGLRSSYTGLASISVTVGEMVFRSQPVGRSATTLHLGVRRGPDYLDPASLFGNSAAYLVPVPSRGR